MRKAVGLAIAVGVLALASCGGSGSSSSSSSSASGSAQTLAAIKSCLQKAGYKDLSSANPGQVTVSLPSGNAITLTVESSPAAAKKQLASANRGAAAFFGPGKTSNVVVGPVLIASVGSIPQADFSKAKSCASA